MNPVKLCRQLQHWCAPPHGFDVDALLFVCNIMHGSPLLLLAHDWVRRSQATNYALLNYALDRPAGYDLASSADPCWTCPVSSQARQCTARCFKSSCSVTFMMATHPGTIRSSNRIQSQQVSLFLRCPGLHVCTHVEDMLSLSCRDGS